MYANVRNLSLKFGRKLALAVPLSLVGSLAMAQAVAGTDYGSVAAITSAQVVALAIIAGFITMGIAVWGATYILRRFFPKGK